MRVHILDADANRFKNVYFAREADWERLERLDGSPMLCSWEPIEVQFSSEQDDLPRGDFANFQGIASAGVLSAEAIDALGDLLEGRAELLPLRLGSEQLFLVNVIRLSNALDETRAEIRRFRSSGRIMRVERYAFDRERLLHETIFKLSQLPDLYKYVTTSFVERVERAGLRGFLFDRVVWEDEARHVP